jgi:alpha-mannosidase
VVGGREAMAAPGNVLELYDDRPTDFEAWDLDPFHLETRADCPPAESARSCSPTRCGPRSVRAPDRRAQRMRQTVRLDAEAQRLEFHCAIDWQEDRKALKVRFPVAVLAPRATYEMQFGVVERPTHFNTRADAAQFEVPGHRFADLSEHGFGVALLSAATYGWSTLGGEMRMTLLRSPRWPDPDADRGAHELASRSSRTRAVGRRPGSPPRRCGSTRRCCWVGRGGAAVVVRVRGADGRHR